ncbi:tetratricopeptide repeat protein, partial [Micromonospora sp. CPCC 205371]|nr:tetratricopeptide repeat protein [Micromonospora sp. CPCC 205371]
ASADAALTDLAERRLAVLEDWATAQLALGRHADALPVLATAGAEQPLRERLQELAMLALYRGGRQAEALATFRRLRERLVVELGIEPGPPIQRLHRQILSADPALDATPGPVPRQLPPDVADFTGRHRELADARARLAGSPLRPAPVVAIAGPGGVGKSALAVRVAHRLAHRFPDGQLYADLQGATAGLRPLAPLDVLGRFLRALGVRETDAIAEAEASAAFRAAVAHRRLLVVLDNAHDAKQVRPLLPAGPHAATLVTSRRVLSTLDGAAHVHLEVLPEPEAVRLLARLAGADRVAADPGATRLLARRCGHLPLALRIAGARLAARPQWPIRSLADRLADARRRLDELQVAELGVRSSFQVSHELLRESNDPDERAAAAALPLLCLPDGPDLGVPAAAALLDRPDAERLLDRLADCHLLECPAPGRYRQHDLVRLFGRDLPLPGPAGVHDAGGVRAADPAAAALGRLFDWYAATAWQAFRLLRPADPRPDSAGHWAAPGSSFSNVTEALEWLEAERLNLVAAVRQVAATPGLDGGATTSLARALFGFFHVRGYLNDWVDVNQAARAIAQRAGDRTAEAHACRDLGAAHEMRGEYAEALTCLRAGLDGYTSVGDLAGQAACLNSVGLVHDSLGQLTDAAQYLERSLAISRQLDDRHSQAISLNNLGEVYGRLGSYERAVAGLQESLAIFRANGNRRNAAASLANLGGVYEQQGALGPALAWYEESLTELRALGMLGQSDVLASVGRVHRKQGRNEQALACLREALEIGERSGERRSVAAALYELGLTERERGAAPPAQEYWRRALAIFEELGLPEAAEVATLLKGL